MTPEEIKQHAADQKAAMKKVEENIEKAASKEEVEKLISDVKTLNDEKILTDKKREELEKALKDQGEIITVLEKRNEAKVEQVFGENVRKGLEENKEKLQAIKLAGQGFVTIKVAADITTGNQSLPAALGPLTGTQIAPPTNVGLRDTFIDSLITTVNTNQALHTYTETLPKDGDFSFIGEGDAAAQIDLKMESRQASVKKIAAYERLTEEALVDIPRMQSIGSDYLAKKHALKRQNGLLFGDGTGDNPEGATTIGRVFSAGAMATAITNPNFMDVLNAGATDIYTTHNYTDEVAFVPNVALINPTDFFIQFVAAKDGDGKPLYPTASLFNRANIGGMLVIPERSVPAGKIFIGDLSKYNASNYIPYTLDIGYINDDFIKGQLVMRGSSRFHAYTRQLDRQAFLYDDIATIKTAITAS